MKEKRCSTCHQLKSKLEFPSDGTRCNPCLDALFKDALSRGTPPRKVCSSCKVEQYLSSFYQSRERKDGFYPACIKCCRLAKQKNRIKNPVTREQRIRYRETYIKKYPERKISYDRRKNLHSFGLSIQEYDTILEKQGGTCSICKEKESTINPDGSTKSLAVDHCHESDEVRGLLCSRCNTALGLFKDSTEYLQNAILYLERKT